MLVLSIMSPGTCHLNFSFIYMAHTTQKTVFCETNMQYFDIEQCDIQLHSDKTKDTCIY